MEWCLETPKEGDMIRVKIKFYYHYGVYVSDDEVIQFGLPDNGDINPDDIEVLSTDISGFLMEGIPETAKLNAKEKLSRRSKKETVKYARSRIGQKGYNILHNNCEHFANECLFRKRESELLTDVRQEIRSKLKKEQ